MQLRQTLAIWTLASRLLGERPLLEMNGDILWTQQRSSGVRSERRRRRRRSDDGEFRLCQSGRIWSPSHIGLYSIRVNRTICCGSSYDQKRLSRPWSWSLTFQGQKCNGTTKLPLWNSFGFHFKEIWPFWTTVLKVTNEYRVAHFLWTTVYFLSVCSSVYYQSYEH